MNLLSNFSGTTNGSEPWIINSNGGSFWVAFADASVLGGGAVSIQVADLDENLITPSADLSWAADEKPDTGLIFLPAGIKVRAQVTGGTGATIPFFRLIPADHEDKNRYGQI